MKTAFPLLLTLLWTCFVTSSAGAGEDGVEFFEEKVRPVLALHCYKCHSAKTKRPKGGLLLDTGGGILKGGESGAVVVAGKVAESLLIKAISYSGEAVDMPPDEKLPDRVIADLRTWIGMGAPLPDGDGTKPRAAGGSTDVEEGRDFWSFKPLRELALPEVSDPSWPRQRLDWFVLKMLDEHQMRPASPADRRVLARRVWLDLVGLPPTFEQIEAFVSDGSPDAYERLVDTLLASPRHGERWGRHWLDVARYAEDNPTSESTCKPPRFPFRYRDWVIGALNDDLTYDQFVQRQLAADLMDDVAPSEIAALGLLGLSPVYHKEPKLSKDVISVIVADEWDERIDTITRGLLALTVGCARCHDHKYDPIKMEDYYALAGVLASTQLVEWPMVQTTKQQAETITEVRRHIVDYDLRLSYAKIMRETALSKGEDTHVFEQSVSDLQSRLEQFKKTRLFDGPIANAVRDAGLWVNGDDPAWTFLDFQPGVPRDMPVFLRGSVTNPGKVVPRRFIEVLSRGDPSPFQHGSGRLELAQSILDDAGPLAARVIVNRVWGWHFGRPLVATPSNFGRLGDRPASEPLLDDLSARFVRHGWSFKWLHRQIVLSATYRQASRYNEAFHDADPDNRYLWRASRQRLSAEAWRDAVLSVVGWLDGAMGGPSASLDEPTNRRRSVYGTISRQRPADVLRLFDFPDAKRHSDRRILTTTPLQQLYLLNSSFLQQNAAALAGAVADQAGATPHQIVRRLFRRILLREPSPDEFKSALSLVADERRENHDDAWSILAHALLASNEFMYVD